MDKPTPNDARPRTTEPQETDSVVTPFGNVKNAREVVTESLHNAMKITALLKRDYTRLMAAGELAADLAEGKYFETYCGGDIPARVKQLAAFCNAIKLETDKPMIPEKIVDAHSINTLEKAAPIIAHERKHHAAIWETTEFTKEVIAALTEPGEATKKLKAIRERQVPKEEVEAENVPTASLGLMLGNRILEAADDENGFAVFAMMAELATRWDKNTLIPKPRYAEWLAKYQDALKPAPAKTPEQLAAEKTTDEIAAQELADEAALLAAGQTAEVPAELAA